MSDLTPKEILNILNNIGRRVTDIERRLDKLAESFENHRKAGPYCHGEKASDKPTERKPWDYES